MSTRSRGRWLALAAIVLGIVGAVVVWSLTRGGWSGGNGDQATSAECPAQRIGSSAPSSGAAGAGDLAAALFDSSRGDFSSHFDNSGDSGLVEHGPRPRVVADPLAPGRRAFRMSLGPDGKRSEVLPVGPGTHPQDGENQFVRYSAVLSPDFPTTTPEWQIILQWHHQSNDGSPPLALQVTGGQLMMVSGGDDSRVIGPIAPGGRIDLTMRIRFSRTPDQAEVTVWRDGRPTGVTRWHPTRGTMFTRGAYLKMGMYRSRSISADGAVTITDLKIGCNAGSIGGTGRLAAR